MNYYTEHSELVTHMVSGTVDIGMLPQPNVQTALSKKSSLRIAIDLTEEWNKIENSTSDLVQGCIVASADFINNHKEALDKFLEEYKASAEYVAENPAEAAKLIESAGIIPSAAIAEAAIPDCNIVYIDGIDMKTKLGGFLEVLYNANKSSIGGKIPDEGFYYLK